MTTEIVAYSATEAAVADLTAKYAKVVYDVTKSTGMVEAKKAYTDINAHSITLEKARVKEKAESLAYGRKVDTEAKRIADQLDALRLPIKAQIETETKRAEREAAEKIRIESERILAEQAAIRAAEERRMADERVAIAKAQAELAAQQKASQDKIDADARAARQKIDDEARAAQAERDAADRKARLEREAAEAEAKKARDAEEAKLKAERDRIDAEARALAESKRKEQDAADAKAKAERDAEEAKQRAIKRDAAELMDGEEMLRTFVARFGKRPEFKFVVDPINKYLRQST